MKNFVTNTAITSSIEIFSTGADLIKSLLQNHEKAIYNLNEAIQICKENNTGTINFLTALINDHETIARTLRKAC